MPSARALDAGNAVIKLSLKDEVSKGMAGVLKRTQKIGAGMQSVGAKAAAAGGVVVGAFAAAANSFIEAGAAIDDMSKRTGFGAEALSKLKFAAEQSGSGLEDIATAAQGMAKFMLLADKESAAAVDTLARLGVSLEDLKSQSPEARFQTLAQAISKIQDPTLRAALAAKVFGGAGRALLPLLVEGSKGIQALGDEAQRLGLVMTDEAVAAAAKLDDQLTQLKAQVGGLAVAVGSAIAEPLSEFATLTGEIFAELTKWAGLNPGLIKDIGGMGAAAVIAGGAVAGLGIAITAITAHPIILGITGVTAAVIALGSALEKVEDKAGKVFRLLASLGLVDADAPKIHAQMQQLAEMLGGKNPVFNMPTPATGAPAGAPAAPVAAAPIPTAEDLFGNASAPMDPAKLLDDVRSAFSQSVLPGIQSALQTQLDSNPLINLGRSVIDKFAGSKEAGVVSGTVDARKSEATLDARLASQKFGGRREEIDVLKRIKGHTKKAAERQAGGVAVV